MSKTEYKIVPVYIVKTADIYSLIVYICSSVKELAKFLKVEEKDIINKLNTANKIGNYRVGLIKLKYKKNELEF